MRIVGGKFRSRKISFPENTNDSYETRPTKDRVREAIFSALQDRVMDRVVLDLFAGSASLAIEAISRGAKSAVVVDIRKEAIQAIQENVRALQISSIEIFKKDYLSALELFKEQNRKFSLVFLDPPYAMDVYQEVLSFLEENQLVEEEAIYVLESDHELTFPEEKYAIRKYHYGFIHVTILTRKKL